MQRASWLLLQRAVNEGDLTADQANHERSKVKLGGMSTATEGQSWDDLPEQLRHLIGRSMRLQERVVRLDAAVRGEAGGEVRENQVARDLDRLADAFGARAG
jgi:regulator of CtrA degradation